MAFRKPVNAAAAFTSGQLLQAADNSSDTTSTGAIPNGTTATTQAAGDNTTKVATDAFVHTEVANAIAGVNPAVAVQAATTAAADTSGFTYTHVAGIGDFLTGPTANVAVTSDGFTFTTLGQRWLVKNDTQTPSGAFNGIYALTTLQAPLVKPVFTRVLDYDTPSDINNTGAIPVVNGTVNALTSWLLTSTVNTVGTDPLIYSKFSVSPTAPYAVPTSVYGVGVSALTTSSANIMDGVKGAITPSRSGTILLLGVGVVTFSNNSTGAFIELAYGTGSAPNQGDAGTGTDVGVASVPANFTTAVVPFSCFAIVSGLTLGTAYWFDYNIGILTGAGTITVSNPRIQAAEL